LSGVDIGSRSCPLIESPTLTTVPEEETAGDVQVAVTTTPEAFAVSQTAATFFSPNTQCDTERLDEEFTNGSTFKETVTFTEVPPRTEPFDGETETKEDVSMREKDTAVLLPVWVVEKSTPLLLTEIISTSTPDIVAGGVVQSRAVVLRKMTFEACVLPNRQTSISPCTNPAPCTITDVPPTTEPNEGNARVTVGRASYLNWREPREELARSTPLLETDRVAYERLELPSAAGTLQRTLWLETNAAVNHFPLTLHASCGELINPVPITEMTVPPSCGPDRGETLNN
jgi:hypothetical protein